jgi:hypothetical protein
VRLQDNWSDYRAEFFPSSPRRVFSLFSKDERSGRSPSYLGAGIVWRRSRCRVSLRMRYRCCQSAVILESSVADV